MLLAPAQAEQVEEPAAADLPLGSWRAGAQLAVGRHEPEGPPRGAALGGKLREPVVGALRAGADDDYSARERVLADEPSRRSAVEDDDRTQPLDGRPCDDSVDELGRRHVGPARAGDVAPVDENVRNLHGHRMTESLRGYLLIASPTLLDPNFRRTVVLVTAHAEEGAMGLVLNRPAPAEVAEAVPHLEAIVPPGEPVYLGGPVEPSAVTALAELEDLEAAAVPVFGAVGFLPADLGEDAAAAVRRARVFAGYAGWSPGQLDDELTEESWIVEPARPDDVFGGEPDELWRTVLARKGGAFRMLALMPEDPSVN